MAFESLLLNGDFQPVQMFPLSLLGWQETVRAVYSEKVSVVATYDREIRSPSTKMYLPSVVALRQYVPPPKRVAFTRTNVFLRDLFKCAYCGEQFDSRDLSFDHVKPRAKGGITEWTNVVAACIPCNTRKADRGHMKPLHAPFMPTPHQLAAAARKFPPKHMHETWASWLYWTSELEQ